jgi:LPXTG-site transpeptidase (sortase) family protein
VAGRCPHLGLAGNRYQVVVVSSPRHRCYLRGQPERIGSAHQAEICLTSGYRRCRRLRTVASEGIASPPRSWVGPSTQTGSAAAPWASQAPYTELHKGRARKTRTRRRWSVTEFAVTALTLSILLACVFIGFVIAYRAQIGPGMAAPSVVVLAPESTAAAALPTLVPTFTPAPPATIPPPTPEPGTPEAVPDASAAAPSAPTAIPVPELPSPTPAIRQPSDSPPTRLSIPAISLDIPVVPVGVKTIRDVGGSRVVWADVANAAAFHETSAYPGHPGNTVLNGHRDILGSVFRNLNKLDVGDEITVYADGVEYPYYVTETLVVPEAFASARQRKENLHLIGYMPEERLTLITCTPIGLATHRLLIIAKPPEGTAPQVPEADTGE